MILFARATSRTFSAKSQSCSNGRQMWNSITTISKVWWSRRRKYRKEGMRRMAMALILIVIKTPSKNSQMLIWTSWLHWQFFIRASGLSQLTDSFEKRDICSRIDICLDNAFGIGVHGSTQFIIIMDIIEIRILCICGSSYINKQFLFHTK